MCVALINIFLAVVFLVLVICDIISSEIVSFLILKRSFLLIYHITNQGVKESADFDCIQ